MIKSMTGFGRHTESINGMDVTVQIRSVNSRYTDMSVKLPRRYAFLEEKLRQHAQAFFSSGASSARGKIEISASIEALEGGAAVDSVALDRSYAGQYINALRQLRDEFGLTDDMTVMSVAGNRDLFNISNAADRDGGEFAESLFASVRSVFDSAAASFNAMREAEGKRMAEDVAARLETCGAHTDKIEAMSDRCRQAYKEKLEQRITELSGEAGVNIREIAGEERLIAEVALYAEKIAVDEEILRLRSHIKQYRRFLEEKQPVGRKLDFLTQEMNREINTIGSKACDTEIAWLVVEVKGELEKIREQIQNIE